ncbi:hypothetical protein [Stomatohabitans albus]|uniref:hypothetical protein n=1 Tax=Stomatohabitans albus TaxID=3110766 RepID=UPI00300D469D
MSYAMALFSVAMMVFVFIILPIALFSAFLRRTGQTEAADRFDRACDNTMRTASVIGALLPFILHNSAPKTPKHD